MDALVRLMARAPYASITIKQIADQADVAEKTVQRHFNDKSAIFEAFAAAAFEVARARLTESANGRSARSGLERMLRSVYGTYEVCGERIWEFILAERDSANAASFRAGVRAFGDGLTSSLVTAWPDAWRLDEEKTRQRLAGLLRFLTWKVLREEWGLSAEEAVATALEIAEGTLMKGQVEGGAITGGTTG